ncbi:MAG: glycoside hydrolase [Flammeovirgaceae bacterium]|nr:glycoside hydrolase [Flammeovirgaceae bacterium]MBE63230.1 glycoside hydrolase [Flammeovirgaceae bacterium]MBR07376.1 glycoside hydrolase [Rickettsiales bacterium]HCX21416.1 glycoside hydrolase [Cytophagales bacterium]
MKLDTTRYLLIAFIIFSSHFLLAQKITDSKVVVSLDNEYWWGGVVRDGHMMPFVHDYSINLYGNNKGNQIQPLLLSNKGRIVWSEEPIAFEIKGDHITVTAFGGTINLEQSGESLRSAFQFASANYFPPSGQKPGELFFTAPQYNTWIELIYNQNQDDVLRYANGIKSNGFKPGVIMIDDNWQEDYGKWNFHPGRFADPSAMMDSLHSMGFKVMMWICPFVSPDCDVYRDLSQKGYFIKEMDSDEPYMVRWWNGVSAVLDFTNPGAVKWFDDQLQGLIDSVGVDGFKFDAGDSYFYTDDMKSYDPEATPNDHTFAFQKFGLKYPLNEYRASWKMGGLPLAQRLHDKGHNWDDLQKLIPQIGLQGILGYPFNCPDMIGGGEYGSFIDLENVDQELIVRSAQLHSLMAMMQFSVAPWRVLDEEYLMAIKSAVELREAYLAKIMTLAELAASTGEPVIRLMEYVFPEQGFERVGDQFMLGNNILVAPVLVKAATTRMVKLPKGKWKYNGKVYKGGKQITIPVSLDTLPVFEKL